MSTKTLHPSETHQAGSRKPEVGLAFISPHPGDSSWLSARVARGVVQAALADAGLSAGEFSVLFGQFFALATAEVSDAKAGARAVHKMVSRMGLLDHCEVAWFDVAEDYWRTAHPQNPLIPFGHFLTPENLRFAREAMDRLDAYVKQGLAILTKEIPPESSQDQDPPPEPVS